MRALITGASGFIGGHLRAALSAAGWECIGGSGPGEDSSFVPLDLADTRSLRAALDTARPDVVFHLAGQAAVPESLARPIATYDVNAIGTARLLEAVREYRDGGAAAPRVVFAGSADVYGARSAGELPLRESLAPRPMNPYAASKAAAEAILLGEASSFGHDVVLARTFNAVGPGQSTHFAVASFAHQLASIAKSGAPGTMSVGDLSSRRDFVDVRDVAEAFVALAQYGVSGEIYNICSGNAVGMRDVLRELIGIARVPVEVRTDPAHMRPSDTPVLYGSYDKLHAATGWLPSIPLSQTLRDVYEHAAQSA